jgi:hypothetical protein
MVAEGASNELVSTAVIGVVATGFFGMIVAFINKYRGRKVNVAAEVTSLSQAVGAMDIALKSMRTEYDAKLERCEAEHENCERELKHHKQDLAALRHELFNLVKPDEQLPMYHLNGPKGGKYEK